MADMLLRGPNKSWGQCTCKMCVKSGERRGVRRINRKRDDSAWQQDQVAGERSTPLDSWHDAPDDDWVRIAGNYGSYAAQPPEEREPYAPYAVIHHRPLEREEHEAIEASRKRIRLRVEARMQERESRG